MGAFRRTLYLDSFAQYFATVQGLPGRGVTDYSGDAKGKGPGESLTIFGLTLPDATDGVPGSLSNQAPTDITTKIELSKYKYLNLPVTTLEEKLNDAKYVDELMAKAATSMLNAVDKEILKLAGTSITPGDVTQELNTAGDPWSDELLFQIIALFDNNSIPQEDRIIIATPEGKGDLQALSTFTSGDFGAGQNQNVLGRVRNMTVIERPKSWFPVNEGKYSCLALHKSAIGFAAIQPHMRRVEQAGQHVDILENGLPFGLKVLNPLGVIRVLR